MRVHKGKLLSTKANLLKHQLEYHLLQYESCDRTSASDADNVTSTVEVRFNTSFNSCTLSVIYTITCVQVSLMLPGWCAEKVLCHTLQGIGKAMVQGSWRDNAAAVLKSEPLSTLVIPKDLNVECSYLSSRDFNSAPQKLVSIRWAGIVVE